MIFKIGAYYDARVEKTFFDNGTQFPIIAPNDLAKPFIVYDVSKSPPLFDRKGATGTDKSSTFCTL
jgi:hypothetical protein